MSIFNKLNPFRRPCCQVPLVIGNYEKMGSVVTGVAQIEGAIISWVGIVESPDTDNPVIDKALDDAEQFLIERMEGEQP